LGASGIIAILFGLTALFYPGIAAISLVFFFGIFAVIHGIFLLFGSIINRREYTHWGLRLFEGIFNIALGVAVLAYPGITVGVFMLFLSAWALVTGIVALINTFRFRENRWLNLFGAIVSFIAAVLLFTNPFPAAVGLTWIIGLYAIILGGTLIASAATAPSYEAKEGKTIEIHKKAA
jgi:uncharacterized membrane protein HdeD (DUF308 family)